MKQSLIQQILQREWDMFSQVPSQGGKASCQCEPETFAIMRRSQANTWPENLLIQWLDDLEQAQSRGRNLMSEKYARMMESTAPNEFRRIADQLPPVDTQSLPLIEDIVATHVRWKEESAKKYPRLNGMGRLSRSREDSPWDTSFETYLRGEIQSCSPQSLRLLHAHTQDLQARGVNGAEAVLLNQAREYGYGSLEAAEDSLKKQDNIL